MSALSKTLDAQLSINDILRHHPAAVAVLSAYRIDSCCRGDQSLAIAAADLGLDPARIAEAIVASAGVDAELPVRCSCGHAYANEAGE
jgi:iron-sulfur cluster repair protein YtfE (RIC family)